MKRIFINQNGDSNKFWSIDQTDNSYTVAWGKIGTGGRTKDKTFLSANDCSKETLKLIEEKLSKGYHEASHQENIPGKPLQQYRSMDEEVFWEIISSFNWKKLGDDDAVLRPAIKRLVSMSIEDIFEFAEILAEKLYLLDGIAYASNIGDDSYKGEDEHFSVDYFLYVRCCVVANGKEFFNYVILHPEQMPKNADFEPLLNLPVEAYNRKTKTADYNYTTKFDYETFSNVEGWKKK